MVAKKPVNSIRLHSLRGSVEIVEVLFELLVEKEKGWFNGQDGRFCFNQALLSNHKNKRLRMTEDLTSKLAVYLNAIFLNEPLPLYSYEYESLNKLARNAVGCEFDKLPSRRDFFPDWFQPLTATEIRSSLYKYQYKYQCFNDVFESLEGLVQMSGIYGSCHGVIMGTLMAHQIVTGSDRFFALTTSHKYGNHSWKIVIQDPTSEMAEYFALLDIEVCHLEKIRNKLVRLVDRINRENYSQDNKGRIYLIEEPHLIKKGKQGVFFNNLSSIIDAAASPSLEQKNKMDLCPIHALPHVSRSYARSLLR